MDPCDLPVISGICGIVEDGVNNVVAAPFVWLANAIGEAAKWMVESLWSVFDSTTLVDLTSDHYISNYNIVFGVAVFVTLIFFLLQLITGMIRRDPTALSTALLGLGRAVLGSFVVITLTATALEIVDQLCIGIVQAAGSSVAELGGAITTMIGGLLVLAPTSPGAAAIVVIFLGGLAIAAIVSVWLSLIVRKALLLVAVVLAPIALSGTVWEHTKGWASKWISFVVALVISKLIVVIIFLVAVSQISAPIDLGLGWSAIADPLAGIVLLALAAFAPYMAFKLISFIGFDLYQTMSAEQETKQALDRPMPILRGPGNAQKVLDAAPSGGSPGRGASAPSGGQSTAATASTGASAGSSSAASTSAAGGSAASGAGAGSGAAAGAGAAAAAPVAAAVIAVEAGRAAAGAGPRAGRSIAASAEQPSEPPAARPPAPRPSKP